VYREGRFPAAFIFPGSSLNATAHPIPVKNRAAIFGINEKYRNLNFNQNLQP
jgi:hypothetical protein